MVNTSKHASNPQETQQSWHPGVTFRAILIGIILIPPNTYFIMANHLRYRSTLPTTIPTYLGCVGLFFLSLGLRNMTSKTW